jgi:hypothetical protein
MNYNQREILSQNLIQMRRRMNALGVFGKDTAYYTDNLEEVMRLAKQTQLALAGIEIQLILGEEYSDPESTSG